MSTLDNLLDEVNVGSNTHQKNQNPKTPKPQNPPDYLKRQFIVNYDLLMIDYCFEFENKFKLRLSLKSR